MYSLIKWLFVLLRNVQGADGAGPDKGTAPAVVQPVGSDRSRQAIGTPPLVHELLVNIMAVCNIYRLFIIIIKRLITPMH
jgi:hypothetical protein